MPETEYIAEVDLGATPTESFIDDAMDTLAPCHGVVSATPEGGACVTFNVLAPNLLAAVKGALTIADTIGEPIGINVLPMAVRDAREGFDDLQEWISVADAAALAGVSRQRIAELRRNGVLEARRLGARAWAIHRPSLTSWMGGRGRQLAAVAQAPASDHDGGKE